MCAYFYLTPKGRVSAIKTMALASISSALVASLLLNAKVWYGSSSCEPPCKQYNVVVFTWSGTKPDLAKVPELYLYQKITLESANARSALPLTFVFNWIAEAVAAMIVVRLVRKSKRTFLLSTSIGVVYFWRR